METTVYLRREDQSGGMAEGAKCWICGRTSEEVRVAMDRPSEREVELEGMMAKVEDSRRQFERTSRTWSGGVPAEFKDTEFAFVLENPNQFRSLKFVDEVARAKRSLADSLVDAAEVVLKGGDANLGIVEATGSDKSQADLIVGRLHEFARSSGRGLGLSLPDGPAEPGGPTGFEGLTLRDGIRYLTEVGLLYFTIQRELLQAQKGEVKAERPGYRVAVVKVRGHPAGVPLCSVCELLIK